MKEFIESTTNGNSKGLAWILAIGVTTLVLNFSLEIIDRVIAINQVKPRDVLVQVESMVASETLFQTKQVEALQSIVLELNNISNDTQAILKEAEKMERFRQGNP